MPLPSDFDLFGKDNLLDPQQRFRNMQLSEQERRQAKLFLDLANLTKRFINERLALESMLSERGMAEFSASIYALEWDKLYYAERDKQEHNRKYWRRLWLAILNK